MLKTLIARHPLVAFFVLAIALSWIAALPLLANPELAPEPFQILGSLAGPTLSAFIVLGATEGRQAFGRFQRRCVQWRAGVH